MRKSWTCVAANMAKMAVTLMNEQNRSTRGQWCGSGTKTPSQTGARVSRGRRARRPSSERGRKNILETALADGSFATLTTALAKADLLDVIQGRRTFTVFAPTDEAFAAVPEDTLADWLNPVNRNRLRTVLGYHLIEGRLERKALAAHRQLSTQCGQRVTLTSKDGELCLGEARLTVTDIACSNGIIHVVDKVLVPSLADLARVLADDGRFSRLIDLIKRVELLDLVQTEGPYTLLAPTDEAFAALPEETATTLTQSSASASSIRILKYHLIQDRVFAQSAAAAESAKSVSGDLLFFGFRNGRLAVNEALITQTDLQASNGVIHVIDKVLLP